MVTKSEIGIDELFLKLELAIRAKHYNQVKVAAVYAQVMLALYRSTMNNDGFTNPIWQEMNLLIKERWPNGLERVKKLAWDIYEAQGAIVVDCSD